MLKEDLYRYEGERSKSFGVKLRYLFFTPGFAFTFFFRRASACKTIFGKILYYPFYHITKVITGIQIPIGTKIGKGLKIGHFGTIVVNPFAEIGENFNIAQGCLVGNALGKRKGVPKIGNNVVMSANSVVIGNVTIGNNVLIAPLAFVNVDVPDNCIVIGNPAKIIQKDSSPTSKYIVFPAPGTDLFEERKKSE